MKIKVSLDNVYAKSNDVVARKVQGEFIIIPITAGIQNLEDAIYTLNETGESVWNKMDGKRNLRKVTKELSSDFTGSHKDIKKDVIGLTQALLKRRILCEVK